LTATVVAMLGIGGASLTSLAAAESDNNPKADIQSGNFFCGFDLTSAPVIGFTNYHRTGDTVSIEYHLKGAIPNATYTVSLWGDSCSYFGDVTSVTTNAKGVANGNGSITVPSSSTRFFATGLGPNGYNDTPAVTLAP
jgi:hypothetical protein